MFIEKTYLFDSVIFLTVTLLLSHEYKLNPTSNPFLLQGFLIQ